MSPSKSTSGENQKEGEYDRISSLPDDVLCHILSLLPTKYSVSTTVLSARWKNLFASVPDLNLDDSMTGAKTLDASLFNVFVSKVLLEVLKKLSHVRKFRLKCARGPCCASLVSLWISAATGCSTLQLQELLIYIEKLNKPVLLPPELFACQTLTTLNLKGTFVLCVPGPVILPTLKSLELSKVILSSEESVKNLLCGCIVLENLYFSDCTTKHIDVLEVSGNYLKELRLHYMSGDYNFVIDAPCLEIFYCDSYASRGYYGDNLYSLVRAVVELILGDEHFEEEKVSQLVNVVSRASSLTLSGDVMEALTKPNHTLEPFYFLRKLRVYADGPAGWESLPTLLDNAPYLEVLSFNQGFIHGSGSVMEVTSYLPEWIPTCVSLHLKEVIFDSFMGDEFEFELVEYFLKNAKVLEKVVIYPYLAYDSNWRHCLYINMKTQFPMTMRLLALPRSSRACRIVFTDGCDLGV